MIERHRRRRSFVGVILLLILLSGLPVIARDQEDRLTPMDLFELEYASDPQISPDGRYIVYVRRASDVMTDQRYSNLWIISFDGKEHRPLTTGISRDSSPRWSPDGTRIAYISDREGSPQIYVRWMDTGQTARITNVPFPPEGIAWSPNGRSISFAMFVPEPPRQIGSLPAPPPGAKWADSAMVIDRLVYRFNGAGYLKPGYTHLFIVPAEGGTPRQISSGKFHHGGVGFRASEAVWTPDGKALLISANRRPDFDLEPLDTEIYEFSIADGLSLIHI